MDRSFKTGSRAKPYRAPRLALAITTAIAGLTLASMTANAAPGAQVSFSKAQTALSKGQVNKAITYAEAAVSADPRNPDALHGLMALDRHAHPDEIAGMVAYLAGPESGMVTGASLLIDGGFAA